MNLTYNTVRVIAKFRELQLDVVKIVSRLKTLFSRRQKSRYIQHFGVDDHLVVSVELSVPFVCE